MTRWLTLAVLACTLGAFPTAVSRADEPEEAAAASLRARVEALEASLARARLEVSAELLRRSNAERGIIAEETAATQQRLRTEIEALFDIPEVPAAFALGTAANPVARPTTVREAVSQVMSAIDASGLRPGIALELAPVELARRGETLSERADASWGTQVLDSIRLSLATSADPEDEDGSLLALGLRVSLLDRRNYRYNEAVRAVVRGVLVDTIAGLPVCPDLDVPLDDDAEGAVACSARREERLRIAAARHDATIEAALEALDRGGRIELALALVLDGDAALTNRTPIERRDVRVWLAADKGFGGGSYGAALDLTITGRATETSTNLDDSFAFRAGGFVEVERSWGGATVHLLYVHEEVEGVTDPSLTYAGVLRLRASTGATARVGLVATSRFGDTRETRAELIAGVELGTPMVPRALLGTPSNP